MKKKILFFILFLSTHYVQSQNLGGSATYGFLKLPQSASVSALGGTVVVVNQNDASLVQQNPALLVSSMQHQLHTSIQFLYGSIKNVNANYSMYKEKIKTSFNGSIQYVNYGNNLATDASGNIIGNLNANDYVIQVTASKIYLQKWNYGATLKFIGSNYNTTQSYGIAIDAGISYTDSANKFKVGLVFKNIGTQLKAYTGNSYEALPFDVQLGLSKKLANAPLQFVATITNAHQFDIRYADTTFDQEINGSVAKGKFTIDKLFRHLIIGTQIFPSKNTEITIAYNYLRRKELGVNNIANGFTGFSMGAGLLWKQYQFKIAQSYFQNTKPYIHMSLYINFDALHY